MEIKLNQREKDTIARTIEILSEYEKLWKVKVEGKQGTFFNEAGTAISALKFFVEEKEAE